MKIYILNIFRYVYINLTLDNCLMATGGCFEGYGGKLFLTIMFSLIEFLQYHCLIKKTHHRICLRKFI